MPGKFEAAISPADVMYRLRQLETRFGALATARSLEAATIGRGGMRIQGGVLRIQDIAGDDMFRAGGDPGEVFIRDDILAPFAVAVLANRTYVTPENLNIVRAFGNDSSVPAFAYAGAYDSGGNPAPHTDLFLEDVEIITGTALVTISAETALTLGAGNLQAAHVSFEVTGATQQSATDSRGAKLQYSNATAGHSVVIAATTSRTVFIAGLNPGSHNFRMMYRNEQRPEPVPTFAFRNMTVIAF